LRLPNGRDGSSRKVAAVFDTGGHVGEFIAAAIVDEKSVVVALVVFRRTGEKLLGLQFTAMRDGYVVIGLERDGAKFLFAIVAPCAVAMRLTHVADLRALARYAEARKNEEDHGEPRGDSAASPRAWLPVARRC